MVPFTEGKTARYNRIRSSTEFHLVHKMGIQQSNRRAILILSDFNKL